jgi:hypothetical protein
LGTPAGRGQGQRHSLGNLFIDHARSKLAQIGQPGFGAVGHAGCPLEGGAGHRQQPAADGQVVGHISAGLKQGHAQAARLRGQGDEHTGSARAQNGQIGLHQAARSQPRRHRAKTR